MGIIIDRTMTFEERIEHIEAMLTQLVERQAVKDFYTPEEFARLVRAQSLSLAASIAASVVSGHRRKLPDAASIRHG